RGAAPAAAPAAVARPRINALGLKRPRSGTRDFQFPNDHHGAAQPESAAAPCCAVVAQPLYRSKTPVERQALMRHPDRSARLLVVRPAAANPRLTPPHGRRTGLSCARQLDPRRAQMAKTVAVRKGRGPNGAA